MQLPPSMLVDPGPLCEALAKRDQVVEASEPLREPRFPDRVRTDEPRPKVRATFPDQLKPGVRRIPPVPRGEGRRHVWQAT